MESYAAVAAENSQQSAQEASAPPPQTIVPQVSDVVSSSSSTGPGGVHVIRRSEISEINTSDESVTNEPGPSLSFNAPVVHDETAETVGSENEDINGSLKDKLKRRKSLSASDECVLVYTGIGSLNLLAFSALAYWGWRKYTRDGENGWKILGFAAGAWVGLSAFEWLGMRAISTWKHKRDKSS